MNWNLFTAVLAIGLAAALLNLRRDLSPREAWALVLTRTAAAWFLARYLPEQANGAAIAALAVWETARLVAGASAYAVHWFMARREGRKWLRRWQHQETRLSQLRKTPGGISEH